VNATKDGPELLRLKATSRCATRGESLSLVRQFAVPFLLTV